MILHGDSLELLKTLEENSVDSVVTDPPYGIGFMGKAWDTFKPGYIDKETTKVVKPREDGRNVPMMGAAAYAGLYDLSHKGIGAYQDWCYEWGKECLRVLKPGGHLLASNSPRMYHRMTIGLEDAGFEIRDQIMWVYGSGFPKSHNLKGEWEGWGTALKPAHEPIVVARKPFKGTVAENVLTHGTGALNIDGCRVGTNEVKVAETEGGKFAMWNANGDNKGFIRHNGNGTAHIQGRWPANLIHDGSEEVVSLFPVAKGATSNGRKGVTGITTSGLGKQEQVAGYADNGSAARFFKQCNYTNEDICQHQENKDQNVRDVENPVGSCETPTVADTAEIKSWDFKNVESQAIQDSTIDCKSCIQHQNPVNAESSESTGTTQTIPNHSTLCGYVQPAIDENISLDTEGRGEQKYAPKSFLYCAKASKKDRDEGLENTEDKTLARSGGAQGAEERGEDYDEGQGIGLNRVLVRKNNHPTVKPTALMQYLVRLVTPPGGTVLDPFMGSGSTGKACMKEGFNFIGIERELEYVEIAKARIEAVCS